jgi:hypothetical protein
MTQWEVGDEVKFARYLDLDLKLPVAGSDVPVAFGSDSVCCQITAEIVAINVEGEEDTEDTPGSPPEYETRIREVKATAFDGGEYALRRHVWQHEESDMEEEAKAAILDRSAP